ncbi:neurofilament heavy polypeptide [Zeugodacus cucurbitae]|uniref:neurofilament heavy polypeptide n=1 Tax=Zeugodacus cucurbitae TaxID=28588 RepID=UPI00059690F2|nr:neurofilament heavy polypeptide [Zeugodacus cucurbitae]
MNHIYNEQQQKKLTRAIAMRALMYASGDNCYCPVKKPTKFIVTLKPVVKAPNADPYLSLEAQRASGCTCNLRNQQNTQTAEKNQVRTNNEALQGKTLLNAFRVLTNSKFITIDPKYDYGDSGVLSPSCQKIRLCGGSYETRKNNENCECSKETKQVATKTEKNDNKFLQPGQERTKPEKRAKSPKSKPSQISFVCENGRIYRILQRGCYEKGEKAKKPPKYRVVYPGGEKPEEMKKEPKKEKEKTPQRSREPSKEREQLKCELKRAPEQEDVTPPPMTPPHRCAEKAVGTSDAPSATSQQQNVLDMISWSPLKYFDINCNGAAKTQQTEEEPCMEKPPCPLSIFPFPSIRKIVAPAEAPTAAVTPAAETEPLHTVKEEPIPCLEREVPRQPLQTAPPSKSPDVSKEIIAQQCNRIHNLELQVNELRRELGHMKTEIIPPDEMLRCTALTAKLRELSSLLADLKTQHTEAISAVLLAQRQAAEKKKLGCTAVTQTPRPPTPPPPPTPPVMKAETVQTHYNAASKLSQTNASFGWRPFIDEATQSSPPSTVPVTPKNTSSAPVSSHASSAASSALPCRHGTGELPLKESPSFCPYCQCSAYPRCVYIESNLYGEIMRILQHHAPCEAVLSVLLQPNNIYHINISLTSTGEPLGCIYATERAINEAVEADVFNRFLTFFIVDARISVQQKEKILAHTFEFFKN